MRARQTGTKCSVVVVVSTRQSASNTLALLPSPVDTNPEQPIYFPERSSHGAGIPYVARRDGRMASLWYTTTSL